jgi:hypothetical protein
MSPKNPGITINPDGRIDLKLEVRNFGTTPGRMTDYVLSSFTGPKDSRLPIPPQYTRESGAKSATAFLVAGDFVTVASFVTVSSEEAQKLRSGEREIAVFGYVDYIDQFRQRHRAGMGRRFDRTGPSDMNLSFMVEPGYNYDRARLPGEGNDWDENG